MTEHLYIHIPYCAKICPYCSFYKSPAAEAVRQGGFGRFVAAMVSEARTRPVANPLRTVFLGGGTPTVLNIPHLTTLLEGIAKCYDLSLLEELTVEMNPATVSPAKADALLSLGATRASIGVQSWNTSQLDALGRNHSAAQAERTYQTLRTAGFPRINIDQIFGVPGQNIDDWHQSLEFTVSLSPEHISAYSLTYEEDTEFFDLLGKGKVRQNPDLDAEMFNLTARILAASGYLPYETSNYCRPGFECRHHIGIWRGQDYLGLGPSAVTTIDGIRSRNVSDTLSYIERIEQGGSPVSESEQLSAEDVRLERIAIGLRTMEGIDLRLCSPGSQLEWLCRDGLAEVVDGRLCLTESGRPLVDEIALQLTS